MISTAEVGRRGRDEFIATYNRSIEERQEIERKIADAVTINPEQIILYFPDISAIKVRVMTGNSLARLNDFKVVEDQYEHLWKLYVFAPDGYRERVGQVCKRIFGEPNALT